ncbi:hypothetical protein DPMN_026732 [Dreissena polymorpha]|uniref:Uncharacterized protein n=1 Tax=Dreissena polymorpha TaxID=45954 RepID=A0A9D4LTZ8_DREPO|nr:hypothetical protein DPMN_026732 [Dreissena polymorpha]
MEVHKGYRLQRRPFRPLEIMWDRILTGLTPISKNFNKSLRPGAQLFSPNRNLIASCTYSVPMARDPKETRKPSATLQTP